MEASLILSTDPKCFKSALRRAGPIPGIESKLRGHAQFLPLFAMGRDPIAMRLIADALHEIQPLRMARQLQRFGLVREENFLLLFCQPDNRDFIQ